MIVFAGLVLGAALGWIRAGRRGGNRLDRLQYAAAHAIAFAVAGLFVAIAIDRLD